MEWNKEAFVEVSEPQVIIKCGSHTQVKAVLNYLDECQLDFVRECAKKDIKIRYFDVEYKSNTIVID